MSQRNRSRNLWAPWRISYIKGLTPSEIEAQPAIEADSPPRETPPNAEPSGCFFCDAHAAEPEDLSEHHVLIRDDRGVLLLNRYPYSNGHLLAAPRPHAIDLAGVTREQHHGLMDLLALGDRLLRHALHAQGVNLGMNLGRAAGAGVPGHLHAHLVPRWHGDTNFMDIVGGVRVIPENLDDTYDTFRRALAELNQ